MTPRDRDQQKRDGEKRDLGQQVEGRRAVRELSWPAGDASTRSGSRAMSRRSKSSPKAAHVRVRRVPADQLERKARTGAPQGVVAFAAPIVPADVDAMLADPAAFLVALDGVTDPQNLGAVMRTAETTGATGMLLPRHRAVGLTPAVAKAAAGALEYLPVAFVSGIPGVLERAARAHVWCVGLDATGDTSVFDLPVVDQPLVLVLGAEGRRRGSSSCGDR